MADVWFDGTEPDSFRVAAERSMLTFCSICDKFVTANGLVKDLKYFKR